MFFFQYILPNLISIFSLLISGVLGYLTYKLDKTTKTNDNQITKQKLEIENLREQNTLIQNKITETAVRHLFNNPEKNEIEIKTIQKKAKNIIAINNDKNKKEKIWLELKIYLINKK